MLAHTDAAGFVLVGGRSSRMGADKASLTYQGMPLACYVAAQIAPVVDRVSLVGNPMVHGNLGLPVVADEHPGAGPVSAIISALRSTTAAWNIVTACDLPHVRPEIFQSMLHRIQTYNVQCVVPLTPDGREQVLCAVYRRDALHGLETAFAAGEVRLRTAVRQLQTEYWLVESSAWSVNVNTPEEWAIHTAEREV